MKHRFVALTTLIVLLCSLVPTLTTSADGAYGSGSYGACQYGSCSVTVTSNNTVSANVTPSSGTSCTVSSDTVSVTTYSSTGYTLTLIDGSSNNSLIDSQSDIINATSGSGASPSLLTGGTWGYRVDGVNGFGAGPTSASSNSSIPTQKFALVPLSTGSADTIASTTNGSNPTVNTSVWYGVCAAATTRSGTYTDAVVYTATVN